MNVSVADARSKLSELIRAVESGESVTVYRRGVPVVDLVPTRTASGRIARFGTLRGRITINDPDWWKPLSEEEEAAFLEGRY